MKWTIPYGRVCFTDPEKCGLILDVENPGETRWGDLAKRLTVGDPRLIGFGFHGRILERFYRVADSKNDPLTPINPMSPFSVLRGIRSNFVFNGFRF
jgi:hypothetical protein